MVDVVLSVKCDLNRDGDFSDSNEDLSDDVMRADWQIGFANPFDPISRTATCKLLLKNSDKKYSPENSSSAIYGDWTNGRVITTVTTYSATDRTMFVGWITKIRPSPGIYGERKTVVEAEGYFSRASRTEIFIPLQENVTADQVIETILMQSLVYPPGFTGRWLIGITGHSEIGENTILGAVSDYLSAQTGDITFLYIGDQWVNGTTVYGALRDVAGRENGRIFVDRSGVINFWNRDYLITNTTVDSTLDNSMVGVDYDYGGDIVNKCIVTYRTRLVGSSPETLGQTDQAIKVKASSDRVITFRYADQSVSGAKIAGKDAITPQQTTDFTATENEDGTGTDYTTSVTTVLTTEDATRSEVTFTNAAAVDVWIQPGAKIRGTKVTDFGELDVDAQDNASIKDYGYQVYKYPFVMDNADDAQSLADYIVNLRKDPRGEIKKVKLMPQKSDALMTDALSLTIGNRVTLSEDQTVVDAKDYFIIGEQHKFIQNKTYECYWITEPADPNSYWNLGISGFSEIGETTYLGPF